MKTLRQCIDEAVKNKVAIGHFNISNLETLWGVFRAAKNLEVPVIIGVSEGERDFVGVRQAVALVKSLRDEFDYPIFINADHSYSLQRVEEAVQAGFDAVIIDGTELPFEENIKLTKQCVDFARSNNHNVIVEAELGFIGKSSKVLDKLPEGVKVSEEYLTKPEEAERFVRETGINLLAPAVGNIHGMLRAGHDPALNIKRINEIHEACGTPLVLHGGSGNSDEDFSQAIEAGVAIVHISTELRVAYRQALQLSLQENLEEVSPYKYLRPTVLAIEKVAEHKLRVFNKMPK